MRRYRNPVRMNMGRGRKPARMNMGRGRKPARMNLGGYEIRTDPIRIDAPVEFVWDVLADVKNYGR